MAEPRTNPPVAEIRREAIQTAVHVGRPPANDPIAERWIARRDPRFSSSTNFFGRAL